MKCSQHTEFTKARQIFEELDEAKLCVQIELYKSKHQVLIEAAKARAVAEAEEEAVDRAESELADSKRQAREEATATRRVKEEAYDSSITIEIEELEKRILTSG